MKKAFLVLGAPRSGTSVVSHMVNKFGVDFGNPENFLDTEKYTHNPIFFELQWVNDFNDKVIFSLRGKWGDDVVPIEKDFDDLNIKALETELYSLITNEWNNKPIIGIKDPRFCITFPVWKNVLLEMNYEIKILFVYRYPSGCLQSNKKLASNRSDTKFLRFWLQQTLGARYFTKNYTVYFVSYDNVISDSLAESEKMALNFGFDISLASVSSQVVDKSWYHHDKFIKSGNLFVDNCYKYLSENSLLPDEYLTYRSIWMLFSKEIKDLEQLFYLKNEESIKIHFQLQQTQAELEQSQSQLQQTQAELEQSQFQLQQTQAELEQSQSQLQQTQAELEQSQSQLQQTQAELEQSQSQLQQTQAELQHAQLIITAMQTSKFWKLRTLWFRLKKPIKSFFGFEDNEILSSETSSVQLSISNTQVATSDILLGEVSVDKHLVRYSATVDVIVCVHNTLNDVKLCLESVILYSRVPYSLILIDDGNNEETRRYLTHFANSQGAMLIQNEVAKGYAFAANQGLRQSRGNYVVLLDSDTVVTPDWLDRMIACGESDSHIGLVGPLSNTASWQSIPEIFDNGGWAENKLPEGLTVADMGRLVAQYSGYLYPRIPFLNSFCLLIKRKVIEEVGYFDEATFVSSYGEENDYCLRARKTGWQLAIADDAYVYYSQSGSYSHELRKQLSESTNIALTAKYGQQIIYDSVSVCRFDRVLEGIRARSRVMMMRQQLIEDGRSRWESKRVLFILPIMDAGGGGNVVFQEADGMRKMGVDVRILNLNRHQAAFERGYPETTIPLVYVEKEEQIPELLTNYDAVISTLYSSVDWLEPIPPHKSIPVRGYYVQDFEPYFFPKISQAFRTAWNSYTRYPDLVRFTKTEWNRDIVKEQIGVECFVVGPSANIDLYRPRQRRYPNWPERPLRIAAMVRPNTPRRNPQLTMEVLRELYRAHGDTIEIILFGCRSDDPDFIPLSHDFKWCNVGILTRPQLAFLLNEVDIFVDFSAFQAMGLTAMEAMACGVAVTVPQKGGAGSFALHNENSLIVDTSSREACLTALESLVMDENLRTQLQQQAIIDICQYFPERAAYNILNVLF